MISLKASFNTICCCLIICCTAHSQSPVAKNSPASSLWLSKATEYRFNQPDSARYYCNRLLELAKQTDDIEMEAEALRIISISYEAQGNYKDALAFGLKSLSLWKKNGNNAKTANCLNSIGIIYDQQGSFYEALGYYNQAYAIYEKLGDDEHVAMMNVNLGILFKSQGQYGQVLRHYRDAYAIYTRLKLPGESAFCEANLGSVYYYTRQYDSCIYYSLKAERALLQQNNLQFAPVAQANAGLGYLEIKNFIQADQYLNKALAAHRQYGNQKEQSFVLIHLGRLHTLQGNRLLAYQMLKEAANIAQRIGSPQQVMDASKLLANLYAGDGDYLNAYKEYVNYSIVKDTLFEQKKTREISNHLVRYETARKEQQIALLTQRNTIHELALRQQRLYLVIAGLLIAAAGITVFMVYRVRRFQERKLKEEATMQAALLKLEAQNALQSDRLRISRDLHDNIGANLTFIHTSLEETAGSAPQWSDVKELVSDTISELRRTVWLINKPSVRLEEWLVKLREYYRRIDKVTVVTPAGFKEDPELSSRQATSMFRIIQEAVNNSLKHAMASSVWIRITATAPGLQITVEDNGKGFDEQRSSQGFGLGNMQQHAQEAGGTLTILSQPGNGTKIKATFPI